MVDDESKVKPLMDDLKSRKFEAGSNKFPIGGTGAGIYAEGSATSLVAIDTVIGDNQTGLGTRGGSRSGSGSDGADGGRGDAGGL